MIRLETLFAPDIRTATGDPRVEWDPGPPEEEQTLQRATPKRMREFRAGRSLARQAMRGLGLPAQPIKASPDRAPVWPEGIVGSISHCEDLCAVALAMTSDGYVSIGLDIELAAPLDADMLDDICGRDERDWLAGLPDDEGGLFGRTIFSAKECAYKCQYALSGRLLDFHAMTITLDRSTASFAARFEEDAEPFRAGDRLQGRFLLAHGHIVTGMALRRKQLSTLLRDE